MKKDQVLLASFPTVRDAAPLLKWLDEKEIEYELAEPRKQFDVSFAFNNVFDRVGILVLREKHDAIVAQLKLAGLLVPPSEDLFAGFSEEELREVVEKADEWEAEEVARAEALLQEKGIHYSEAEKTAFKARRRAEIRKPKAISLPLLMLALFFSLYGWIMALGLWLKWPIFTWMLGLAAITTLLSIGIGWIFAFLTRKDPWGEEYFVFNPQTRYWGLAILFLSSGMVMYTVFISIYTYFF